MMTSMINLSNSGVEQSHVNDTTFDDRRLVFDTAINCPVKPIGSDQDSPAQTMTRKTYAEYYSVGGEGQFIAAGMGPGTDWDLCATIPSTVLDEDETVFVLSPGLPAMLLPRDLLRQSGVGC